MTKMKGTRERVIMKSLVSTNLPDLILRWAREEDVPLILELILELAEYENLTQEVTADEEILRKSLFRGKQIAEVIIAEYRDAPVGFALFFHNFSSFLGTPGIYLEDLYIKPEVRGKGIGKILLSYLARLAQERGCSRLDWGVLDWNEPAIQFYKNLGARSREEWIGYRLSGKALDELAMTF